MRQFRGEKTSSNTTFASKKIRRTFLRDTSRWSSSRVSIVKIPEIADTDEVVKRSDDPIEIRTLCPLRDTFDKRKASKRKKNMSGGYGICGAINVYSSTAKLGNWVEDKAGEEIARHPRPAKGTYVTDQMANHIDPTTMKVHPKLMQVKMMSTAELKAKNKEGTSYSMLFDHGKALKPADKYTTSNRDRFKLKDCEERFACAPRELEKNKAKDIVREMKDQYNSQAVTKMASSYVAVKDADVFQPRKALGESLRLPNWGREGSAITTPYV